MYKFLVNTFARLLFIRKYREKFLKLMLKNHKYYCCVCENYSVFLMAGANPLANKKCSICGSLERHRFLYKVYKKYFLHRNEILKVLHTAPEICLSNIISKNSNIKYYPVDLEPQKYENINCIKEDITNTSFDDKTFDIILSSHVIEHIDEEDKTMLEFKRILKDDGILFLSLPYAENRETTYENPKINTPRKRFKKYGQSDHVRLYGRDCVKRFKKYFNVEVIVPEDICDSDTIKKESLNQLLYYMPIKLKLYNKTLILTKNKSTH